VYEKASVGQAIHVLTQNGTRMHMVFALSTEIPPRPFENFVESVQEQRFYTNLYLTQDSHNLVHPSAVDTMSDRLPRLPKLSSLFCFDRLPRLRAPRSSLVDEQTPPAPSIDSTWIDRPIRLKSHGLTHGLTDTGSRLISKTLCLQKSSCPSKNDPGHPNTISHVQTNDPGNPLNTFPV